jgi:hypothetical protein
MKIGLWALACLLFGPNLTIAQCGGRKPSATSKTTTAATSELERRFFAIVRNGDAPQLLSYVPDDGVNLGRYAEHATRAEIEEQLTHRTGLYCKLFDSSCIPSSSKEDPHAQACSYRELLTQSEKVRTASTETTRNKVRQAILVAEVQNKKCGGPTLVDFIFNYQQGGWKLFSVP